MPSKNVLFIVVDSMRSDSLSVHGNPVCKTPNLDRLAEAGVSFSGAFAQNPVCAPSRAALLTGWYPHVRGHRTFTYHIRPDEENLLKYFKRAGYLVKAVGTNDCLHEACFEDSMDEWMAVSGAACDGMKGPFSDDPVKSKAFLSGKLSPEQAHDRNHNIKERAVGFVSGEAAESDRPWMHYCAFHIPHPKYGCPDPWYSMYNPDDMPEPIACEYGDKHAYMALWHRLSNMDKLDPQTVKLIRAIYYGMCSLADHYIGEIIQALSDSGQYDDTTIVVVSDHGDYTGDYGLVEKGEASVHDCIINVPLVIKPAASIEMAVHGRDDRLVELIDILPTLLEINDIPLRHNQYGKSLLPMMQDPAAEHKDAVFTEGGYGPPEHFTMNGVLYAESAFLKDPKSVYGPRERYIAEHPELIDRFAVIRTEQYKYVQRGTGTDELYDLQADPTETRNVINAPAHRDALLSLKDRMLTWYLRTSDAVDHQIDDRLCSASWTPEGGLKK